ncbi:MAG: DcrB-related protein, partial [Nocardioidaceae bacterium]|nr:DcrB-related protein [Nocardioidaceae bacterium]
DTATDEGAASPTTTETATTEPTTSQPTTTEPTTTEPTTEATTTEPTTEEPTEPPAGTISGQGYVFALPGGWTDVTQQAQASNPQADVAVAEPATPGEFRMNFNTVSPTPIPGLSREQLVQQAETELRSVTNRKVEPLPDETFDGDSAIGQRSTTDASGFEIAIVQYLVVRDGTLYVTTMTYDVDQESEASAILDGIIESWTWSDG